MTHSIVNVTMVIYCKDLIDKKHWRRRHYIWKIDYKKRTLWWVEMLLYLVRIPRNSVLLFYAIGLPSSKCPLIVTISEYKQEALALCWEREYCIYNFKNFWMLLESEFVLNN